MIQNERGKDKKETELQKQKQKESIQYNNNEVSLTRPLSTLKKLNIFDYNQDKSVARF